MPYSSFSSPAEKRFESLFQDKEFRRDLRNLEGVISRVGTLSERQLNHFCEKWAIPRAFPGRFKKVNPSQFVEVFYKFFRQSLRLPASEPIQLATLTQFIALAGQDFIPEMTCRFLSSRTQGSKRRQLNALQLKRTAKGRFRKKTNRYIRNVPFKLEKELYPNNTWATPSIHDTNSLKLARRFFLIQAAWIVLRGEWEHRDENFYEMSIEDFLQTNYHYLEDILEYKWTGKDNIFSLISKRRFSLYEMSLPSLSRHLHRNGITGKDGKPLSVASLKTQLSPTGYAKASPPAWLTRLEANDVPAPMRGIDPPFEGKGKLSPSELQELFDEVDKRLTRSSDR